MRSAPARDQPRSVTILGATGSVGRSTLALIEESPELFRVEAVTANRNGDALAAIARRVGASAAAVADPAAYAQLRDALAGSGIAASAGPEAVLAAAERGADLVVAGIVGAAGLMPVLAAARRGAMIALANKECLVCAGRLLMREVEAAGATLLPIDSEHNAIFQVMAGNRREDVEKLILTASGGPFRTLPLKRMRDVTPAEAVCHPNWTMGAKISVDSATMMNKGLEVIEAHHLFAIAEQRIEVLIHPQSIVHSLVAFADGSVLAQLGAPDMRIPIAYALSWPVRMPTGSTRLDLAATGGLAFAAPDPIRFPALGLARHALRSGGAAPTILNAANEVAVEAFLKHRIGFLDIAMVIDRVLSGLPGAPVAGIDDVIAIDGEARRHAGEIIAGGR